MSSVLEQIQQEISKLEAGSTQRNVGRIVTLADASPSSTASRR